MRVHQGADLNITGDFPANEASAAAADDPLGPNIQLAMKPQRRHPRVFILQRKTIHAAVAAAAAGTRRRHHHHVFHPT